MKVGQPFLCAKFNLKMLIFLHIYGLLFTQGTIIKCTLKTYVENMFQNYQKMTVKIEKF